MGREIIVGEDVGAKVTGSSGSTIRVQGNDALPILAGIPRAPPPFFSAAADTDVYFYGKSKCRQVTFDAEVDVGGERLDNSLQNYHIFSSPSF